MMNQPPMPPQGGPPPNIPPELLAAILSQMGQGGQQPWGQVGQPPGMGGMVGAAGMPPGGMPPGMPGAGGMPGMPQAAPPMMGRPPGY